MDYMVYTPVPFLSWQRDHISTLIYVETRIIDSRGKGYAIKADPKMRHNHHPISPLGREAEEGMKTLLDSAWGLHARSKGF